MGWAWRCMARTASWRHLAVPRPLHLALLQLRVGHLRTSFPLQDALKSKNLSWHMSTAIALLCNSAAPSMPSVLVDDKLEKRLST